MTRSPVVPGNRYRLPSGSLVQVDRILRTDGVVCHFIRPDGSPTHLSSNGEVTFLQPWLAKYGVRYETTTNP